MDALSPMVAAVVAALRELPLNGVLSTCFGHDQQPQTTHWSSWAGTEILQILSFFRSHGLLISTLGHFYICYRLFLFKLTTAFLKYTYKSYRLNTSIDQQITFRALLSLCLQCFSNTCFFISPKVQFNSKGLTVWLQCWLSSPYVIQAFVAHLLCVTTQLW